MRHNGDNDPSLKQLCDKLKLKGNSFYGKLIQDLMKHLEMTFTIDEELVDKSFRSPFFEDLEEINTVFEIKECKQQVTIKRPYQCSIAIDQLVKLHMLEFYHNFLDKYLNQRNFELIHSNGHRFDVYEKYKYGRKAKLL